MANAAPLHLDSDLRSDSPAVDWPVRRTPTWTTRTPSPDGVGQSATTATGSPNGSASSSSEASPAATPAPPHPASLPGGKKSLSAISLRAFCLGAALGVSATLGVLLLARAERLWRAAFFVGALALFHFLEFYITALRNTGQASVSAFLLTTNGRAYNAAHTGALLECVAASLLFPAWQARVSSRASVALGLAMVLVGQATRTAAMAQAGTNFNHTVQTRRNDSHVLVTHGVYAWLRHPSYFGFFWWGVGTQVVLGNVFCGAAYLVILWVFFRGRIRKEEALLIKFFGKDYEAYRSATTVGIPFIR